MKIRAISTPIATAMKKSIDEGWLVFALDKPDDKEDMMI
jgi:hypothetical protein